MSDTGAVQAHTRVLSQTRAPSSVIQIRVFAAELPTHPLVDLPVLLLTFARMAAAAEVNQFAAAPIPGC